jgi:O-antigen/teichoic acid export membrane protein
LYFLTSLFQKASAIFLIPIYTRFMSPEQYGLLSLCQTVPPIAVVILFLAINESVYFAVMQKKTNTPSIISTALTFQLFAVSIFTGILCLLRLTLKDVCFFKVPFYPYVFITLLGTFPSIFCNTYFQFLQASERSIRYAIMSISLFLISVSTTLYLLVISNKGAMSYLVGFLVSNCVLAIIAIVHLYSAFGFHFSFSEFKKMVSFSSPLIPHNLAHWLKDCIDRLFLAGITQLQSVGIYQIALSYSSILSFAIMSFRDSNNPRFFSLIMNKIENEEKIAAMMPVAATFFSIAAFVMSIFAEECISFLTAKSYHGAVQYVPLVTTAMVFMLIYNNVIGILFNHSNTMRIAVITFSISLFSLGISYLCIKNLGVWGAPVSFFMSNMVLSLSVYFAAQRRERIRWPIRKTITICVLPLLSVAIIYMVANRPLLEREIFKALAFLGYSTACFFISLREIVKLNLLSLKPEEA